MGRDVADCMAARLSMNELTKAIRRYLLRFDGFFSEQPKYFDEKWDCIQQCYPERIATGADLNNSWARITGYGSALAPKRKFKRKIFVSQYWHYKRDCEVDLYSIDEHNNVTHKFVRGASNENNNNL